MSSTRIAASSCPRRSARFAVFQAFFPHLVAGPIVRASELLPQLETPRDPRRVDTTRAYFLIVSGLFLKVVIANHLATHIVDDVFAAPNDHSSLEVLVAVYGYAVQIFADFCGYTNIAIGIALLLGFEFPQNFDGPYTAVSLQDFWRRWHMTLSRWLRDYLYIPLGGSREGPFLTYRNLMLTMLLGGLWHGAAWTFVVWGGIHGAGLCVERAIGWRPHARAQQLVRSPAHVPHRLPRVDLLPRDRRSPMRAPVIARLFDAWGQSSPLVTTSVVLAIARRDRRAVRPADCGRVAPRRLRPAAGGRAGRGGCRRAHPDRHARADRRGPLHLLPLLMLPALSRHRHPRALALPRRRSCRRLACARGDDPAGGAPAERRAGRDEAAALGERRAAPRPGRGTSSRTRSGAADEDAIDTKVQFELPPPATSARRCTAPKPRAAARRPRRSRSSPPPIRCASGWAATRSREIPGQALERVGGAVDVVGRREQALDRARAPRSLQLVHADRAGPGTSSIRRSWCFRSAPTTRTIISRACPPGRRSADSAAPRGTPSTAAASPA